MLVEGQLDRMMLSGHPTGNPNSHHAALAWHEHGDLYKFCTPWFPSKRELAVLRSVPGWRDQAKRLERRHFEPLAGVPMRQSRLAEISRIARARLGWTGSGFTRAANNWLMDVMAKECHGQQVSAVHSFEDCSLRQFREAKRLGKACVYDMPTCHWKFWEEQHRRLCQRYGKWIHPADADFSLNADPRQKDEELRLADVVLAPSTFVKRSLEDAGAKAVRVCRYGVDVDFWCPGPVEYASRSTGRGRLQFIYAGQCSLRKGIPFILEAWEKAQLRDAELVLVGSWKLAADKMRQLPSGVRFIGPVGPERLRELYRQSDVFLFPSFADGFGLVMLEALATGLRVIASDTSGGPDLAGVPDVTVLPAGEEEAWFQALRAFQPCQKPARPSIEDWRWERYRHDVYEATKEMV